MAVKRARPKRTKGRARKKLRLPPRRIRGNCDLPRICKFITGPKGLLKWMDEFWADYRMLRIAVCNVEKRAFSGTGENNSPPKFCKGGGGTEPADPPKPPDW